MELDLRVQTSLKTMLLMALFVGDVHAMVDDADDFAVGESSLVMVITRAASTAAEVAMNGLMTSS